jgi:hypothetical protein
VFGRGGQQMCKMFFIVLKKHNGFTVLFQCVYIYLFLFIYLNALQCHRFTQSFISHGYSDPSAFGDLSTLDDDLLTSDIGLNEIEVFFFFKSTIALSLFLS